MQHSYWNILIRSDANVRRTIGVIAKFMNMKTMQTFL